MRTVDDVAFEDVEECTQGAVVFLRGVGREEGGVEHVSDEEVYM